MTFRAKILSAGKTAAGIEVPAKVVQGLGSSKVPLVLVTINGYTYIDKAMTALREGKV